MKRTILRICAFALLIAVCAGCTTDLAVSRKQDPAKECREGQK
jgi:hypothetical protein